MSKVPGSASATQKTSPAVLFALALVATIASNCLMALGFQALGWIQFGEGTTLVHVIVFAVIALFAFAIMQGVIALAMFISNGCGLAGLALIVGLAVDVIAGGWIAYSVAFAATGWATMTTNFWAVFIADVLFAIVQAAMFLLFYAALNSDN